MRGPSNGRGRPDDRSADRVRADREATDWLIRLQDKPESGGLRADFEIWLHASPVHAAAWAETEQVSRIMSAIPSCAGGSGGVVQANRPNPSFAWTGRRRRAGRASRPYLALSAAAAAACLAVLAGPNLLLEMRADATAGVGEIRDVRLSDGSTARLAPGAGLAIDFAKGERQVRLLRGKAFFEVAHDPSRPFQVVTDNATTTVLGTAFEVQNREAGAVVAVKRGRVRVVCHHDGSDSRVLSRGQALDLECGGIARRTTLEPARVATWTSGQLVANDKPLRAVIDGIRPWYHGWIVARGAGIDRLRVTGVYSLQDPRAALDALAAAHDARVRHISPWITVISVD